MRIKEAILLLKTKEDNTKRQSDIKARLFYQAQIIVE